MKKPSSRPSPLPSGSGAREGDVEKLVSDRVDALVLQGSRALDRGMIYIRKAPSRPLADLIERITSGNMHEPIFNEPIGFERW